MSERKKIAVVEDNADNMLLLRAILEEVYCVTGYEEGTAALRGFSVAPPDLVLLDVSLPGMDGCEVLRRMRLDRKLRTTPVVALTAHAMAEDRERFLQAGFDEYVSKPITDEQVLLGTIRRLLDR